MVAVKMTERVGAVTQSHITCLNKELLRSTLAHIHHSVASLL